MSWIEWWAALPWIIHVLSAAVFLFAVVFGIMAVSGPGARVGKGSRGLFHKWSERLKYWQARKLFRQIKPGLVSRCTNVQFLRGCAARPNILLHIDMQESLPPVSLHPRSSLTQRSVTPVIEDSQCIRAIANMSVDTTVGRDRLLATIEQHLLSYICDSPYYRVFLEGGLSFLPPSANTDYVHYLVANILNNQRLTNAFVRRIAFRMGKGTAELLRSELQRALQKRGSSWGALRQTDKVLIGEMLEGNVPDDLTKTETEKNFLGELLGSNVTDDLTNIAKDFVRSQIEMEVSTTLRMGCSLKDLTEVAKDLELADRQAEERIVDRLVSARYKVAGILASPLPPMSEKIKRFGMSSTLRG